MAVIIPMIIVINKGCYKTFQEKKIIMIAIQQILGQVANHFGVVETNGRGMLNLHALVWLTATLACTTLRGRISKDSSFAAKMIRYMEVVIVQSINLGITGHTEQGVADMPPFREEPSDR